MPKMKTKKSVAARVKVTGSGQLLRHSPGLRHKLSKKSSKRKRSISHPSLVSVTQLKTYKQLIGA